MPCLALPCLALPCLALLCLPSSLPSFLPEFATLTHTACRAVDVIAGIFDIVGVSGNSAKSLLFATSFYVIDIRS